MGSVVIADQRQLDGHAGDLVRGRARRQRAGGAPSQADDPMATGAPACGSAAVLGPSAGVLARSWPDPCLDEASSTIASR